MKIDRIRQITLVTAVLALANPGASAQEATK
jgi:hypothetical protein